MNTFALVIVFPDLRETRLPYEDSTLCLLEVSPRGSDGKKQGDIKGSFPLIYFPSPKSGSIGTARLRERPATENPVRTVERVCEDHQGEEQEN